MNKTLAILVGCSLFIGAAIGDDDHADSAVTFQTSADFKEKLEGKPHFVMFFAPWCGHCKRLAPAWEELSIKYNKNDDEEVVIGKVDCTTATALCSDQDVTGYPTLKFFKSGADSGVKYREQRDLKSLDKFIKKQMGTAEEEEDESLSEPEEAKVENGLYVLSEKSFKHHIKEGGHFIKFYAPWCGHCQKLAPTWEDLGKSFEKDESVKIGKLDCTQAQALCQENEVKGYPTLAFFKDGQKVETYKGARNLKDLKDFVQSMKDGPSKSDDSDKVPEGDEVASAVLRINSDDFESTIKEGVTFIKFFAPWCGHCKRLAPTWDELAAKFTDVKNVKIAKIDCTSNDNKNKDLCNDQGVNGFPTLNIYKDGKKVTEYSGSRKVEDLEAFVKKHSDVSKDEL